MNKEDDLFQFSICTFIAMAAITLPNDAWTKARERFIEDLEEPERLIFAKASLENIFYTASAAQKTHQGSSRSLYLASKLDSFLAGINQYGKAMDVLSQASPFICPLWGALRVLIHVSSWHLTSEDHYSILTNQAIIPVPDVLQCLDRHVRATWRCYT